MTKIYFRNPQDAFQNAINHEQLFENISHGVKYYVGNWMYMHTNSDGSDAFKNIITREYIHIKNAASLETLEVFNA